jgi:vacuolar-type H+-ATPase subunit I/STV1
MSLEGKTAEEIEKLALFANAILTKDTRKDALKLAKRVDPNFKAPELEIDERLEEATAKQDEKLKDLQKELLAERIERNRDEKARQLKEQGYDIVAVEKVMTDNGISNYESAVKFMKGEAALAPAAPRQETGTSLPANFKEIAKNPTKWARDQAHEIINAAARGEKVA